MHIFISDFFHEIFFCVRPIVVMQKFILKNVILNN